MLQQSILTSIRVALHSEPVPVLFVRFVEASMLGSIDDDACWVFVTVKTLSKRSHSRLYRARVTGEILQVYRLDVSMLFVLNDEEHGYYITAANTIVKVPAKILNKLIAHECTVCRFDS